MGGPLRSEVFGTSADPKHSYVDRGRLDDELADLLRSDKHIVIHGDSKQGKTWLRQAVLRADQAIMVQCLPGSTPASLLQEALGIIGVRATLRYTRENTLGGEIDLSASGEIGIKLLAKAKLAGRVKASTQTKGLTESTPIGRAPGDLAWVAFVLSNSGRRLVLEDFHYLPASVQREFSFLLKALLEYKVFTIVMGVWAEDHLLSYYNGDLAGRVEDIRLEWLDEELIAILAQGSEALNVSFTQESAQALVRDAFGNVGLLQRGAEQLCREAGIRQRIGRGTQSIDHTYMGAARQGLAATMAGRFLTFAERVSASGVIYREVLRAVATAPDATLLEGIPLNELPAMIVASGGRRRSKSALREKLLKISEVQSEVEIQPPVLAWDQPSNRLFLVDRAFLYYRLYGTPSWPWEA
jgi:hypothetical protein